MPRNLAIKVCGMKEHENIESLIELPIQYIGHIFYAKSPRFASSLTNLQLPKGIKKTGVFVNADIEEIMERVQVLDLQAIQLHGDESPLLAQELKDKGLEVIKAFGIDSHFDWNLLEPYLGKVDYFLFDSKSPQFGGTGKTFDWEKLKDYPFDMPYFLSGGLSLENLEEALAFQDERLVGLDLNSKFELEPGLKNIENLKLALKIIRNEQISGR